MESSFGAIAMEKDQSKERLNLQSDVWKCNEGDPDTEDASSCDASGSNKDPENKVDSTEKDFGGDGTSTFEDALCVGDLSDDEDDDGDDTEEENQEEDDDGDSEERNQEEEEDDETDYDVEEETNLEFLTTDEEIIDSFFEDDSEKDCKAELGAENVAVAEREPIEFGVLSEFLPVCVVTLDFTSRGNPCYDTRELLKQRLWTHAPEILDQLIILYNLFKDTDTCLRSIECNGAIHFYVQVYEVTAIEKFVRKVKSRNINDILACMLLSCNIRKMMKKLNSQFSVTCHCENWNDWKAEYDRTCHSFRYFNPGKGSRWASNYTDWPVASIFNPGYSEGNKGPKVTELHQRISDDWDSEKYESTSVGQRSTDDSGKAAEDTTMLDTDNRTFLPSPHSNETSASERLIARSNSVDHFSSKCDPSSNTTLNEKAIRRRSF